MSHSCHHMVFACNLPLSRDVYAPLITHIARLSVLISIEKFNLVALQGETRGTQREREKIYDRMRKKHEERGKGQVLWLGAQR